MVSQIALMAVMVLAAILGSVGQIFLSRGSTGNLTVFGLITNGYLWGFVATYGCAVIVQMFVYRAGGKVALIYPVISLSYIFAAFLAWKFLGEPVSAWTWAGAIIIVVGVSLIGYGASIGVSS